MIETDTPWLWDRFSMSSSQVNIATVRLGAACNRLAGFVTPTVADYSFAGKMADGDLVCSPPIPA